MSLIELVVFGWLKKIGDIAKLVVSFLGAKHLSLLNTELQEWQWISRDTNPVHMPFQGTQ